jgi:hypothetical protein
MHGDPPPQRTSIAQRHQSYAQDERRVSSRSPVRQSISGMSSQRPPFDTSPRRQSARAASESQRSAVFGSHHSNGPRLSVTATSESHRSGEGASQRRSISALQRRASNVGDVEQLPPWSEDDTSTEERAVEVAQRLVDRIVATTERRSTVTGHTLDGQLANPMSTLDEMVSSSPPEQSLMSSSLHSSMYGASNRRESRLLIGTTTQQSFHEFAEGSAVSIALQSPKKRISESAADATRRKPSEVVIERAMREAQSLNYSLTSGESDTSRPDANESRRIMMTTEGMCAVPRASHRPSRGSTTQQHHHRYDIPLHQSFSLDQSISRDKPDFRRSTTN